MSCHRSALILAFSVCFGSGCQRETADTRAQDERAIREADAATLKAAQAKDVDGAVANYAEDGSWLPPNAPMVNGKAAIRAGWEKLIGSPDSLIPAKDGKILSRSEELHRAIREPGLRSVEAGKNRSASRRSNQFSRPVCHVLRTWLSRSSIPDRPGRLASSRPPPRGSDALECKRTCCFSRARPVPSSSQHSSYHVLQRAYPYSLGSGPRGCPAFRGPRDKYAIHRPSLILSSRHLGASPPHSDSRSVLV